MAQTFVMHAVLKAIRRLPEYPKLKILDLSCGRGEILSALAREGCEVRGTHYHDNNYKLAGEPTVPVDIPVDSGVDLTKPLSYADGSFDVVILCEVLEHLHSHITVIAEAGRVLRPHGHLILSTPNIARIHSRWHFFLTGTHKLIRRRVGWDIKPSDLYKYHINPVDFPFLHTLLYQSNLDICRLNFTRFKWRHTWWLLFYPLLWLAARLKFGRRVDNDAWRNGERDLFHWMVHPAMVASEQLLVTARRVE